MYGRVVYTQVPTANYPMYSPDQAYTPFHGDVYSPPAPASQPWSPGPQPVDQPLLPPQPPPYTPPIIHQPPSSNYYSLAPDVKAHWTRRRFDYPTLILLLSIWLFLFLSTVILLFTTYVDSSATSTGGHYITADEIKKAIAFSSFPLLIAIILNEVLVERCWRRIECFALGDDVSWRRKPGRDPATMARWLRAANFGWYSFLKRTMRLRTTTRDWRMLLCWMWLRWGCAVSIASTQLCVSWTKYSGDSTDEDADPLYTAHKRVYWAVGPIVLHSIAIFGTQAIWFKMPWKLFSSKYDDFGRWQCYEPYIRQIQAGSIASCDHAADYLECQQRGREMLEKVNKPGLQIRAKLRGVMFGFLLTMVPIVVALLYTMYANQARAVGMRAGLYRFILHIIFQAQNILYVIALDFIIWNLSLEGLCQSTTAKSTRPRTRDSLRYMAQAAGLLLVFKAFRQRRPWRSAFFTWLFWLQACAMRFLTTLYLFCVDVLSYGSMNDRKSFFDPQFWLAWLILTSLIIYPPVLLWLFSSFQAPICEQDGWRWANVIQSAFSEPGLTHVGYYGVVEEKGLYGGTTLRATWGPHVRSFQSAKGKKLK